MAKSGYPQTYGKPTKAISDIKGPLNIGDEGDPGVPENDMAEIEPTGPVRDPMGLLSGIDNSKK